MKTTRWALALAASLCLHFGLVKAWDLTSAVDTGYALDEGENGGKA